MNEQIHKQDSFKVVETQKRYFLRQIEILKLHSIFDEYCDLHIFINGS